MMGHKNARAEAARGGSANETFYNFCARVLLERVTEFVLAHSMRHHGKPKHLRIIFSDRGGMRYSQTIAYLDTLANQARSGQTFLDRRVIKWEVFHPALISAERHEKNAGLQLADSVASALCFAADANHSRHTRPNMPKRSRTECETRRASMPTMASRFCLGTPRKPI